MLIFDIHYLHSYKTDKMSIITSELLIKISVKFLRNIQHGK